MNLGPIKVEPDECIPASHVQMQFNECQRCVDQEVQIQSLQIEIANLRRICTEQSQIIEKQNKKLAKFQYDSEELEHLTVMPLSPIIPIFTPTPQLDKCYVCRAEYVTNDGQKHICNGETEVYCEYCGEVFTSTMDLIDHSNNCHDELKIFHACPKCPEMFSMAQLAQFHATCHPPLLEEPIYVQELVNEHRNNIQKRISKPKGSKRLKSTQVQIKPDQSIKRSLTVKRGRPCKPKLFHCTNCSESFTTENQMLRHKKRHHDKLQFFECFMCKEEFKSMSNLKTHLKKHIRTGACDVCQELCTENEFDSHICVGLESMGCSYCQQIFASTRSLLLHLQNCKGEKLSYVCGKCPKYFLMECLAELHRKNHTENEPSKIYKCKGCPSTFTCIGQLKMHNKEHIDGRTFLCDECGKGFLDATNLRHHKKSHIKTIIQCPQCVFTCTSMPNYRRHLLKHQNIKFICDVCHLQLSNKQKLKIHKNIHTRTEDDRIHGCEKCDKKFYTLKSARAHFVKAHTMMRFECDMCSQSYKYRGDLNKHKRAVHSAGYLYACTHCPQRFPQSYELEKHFLEHATGPDVNQSAPA